ncbi:Het-C domain-containing protein [Pendulispora rubella]|uniref:Het-C domain-containing protein n=1 Tax=Pendulispora rubella TaxID=2741070 RepID=A0ABZ2LDJ2_9BACT
MQQPIRKIASKLGEGSAHFYTHHSIELALREADVKFFTNGEPVIRKDSSGKMMRTSDGRPVVETTPRVLDWVYFGNWLRDNSQLCTAATYSVVRRATIGLTPVAGATMDPRSVLTAYVEHDAKKKSKNGKFDFSKIQVAPLHKRVLGVYRPEEHVDNPKGLKDDSKVDQDFRGTVLALEHDIDAATGLKNYIANTTLIASNRGDRKERGTTAEYIEEQLRDAAIADAPNRYRLLGQALHPLEDLYAHSNFIELMLIRLGHADVFPWVGPKAKIKVAKDERYPMVTGVFGHLDEIYSLLSAMGESLNAPLECKGGMFTNRSITALGSYAGSLVHEGIMLSKGVLTESKFVDFVTESVGIAQDWVKCKLAADLREILGTVGKLEKDFFKDFDNSSITDPTHSMISKDHPDNPLHTVAAKCARIAIKHVGAAMRDVWKNQKPVEHAINVAKSFFVHPNDLIDIGNDPRSLLVLEILHFAKTNQMIVKSLGRTQSRERFESTAELEQKKLSLRLHEWSPHDDETQRRMIAMIPELARLSQSGAG